MEEQVVVKDSNGNVLQDGDTVCLIKDLTVKGKSQTYKRGTKFKIRLEEGDEEHVVAPGGLFLRTEFIKKLK